MRTVIRFQCEGCKQEYSSKDEALECEAFHYNVSLDVYKNWLRLQEGIRRKSAALSISKNREKEKAFNDAIETLIEFEEMHGLNEY